MTQFDEDVLEMAVSRIKAQEMLEDPDYVDRLTIDGLYDLLVRAGYSEETAQEVTNQRSWLRLSAGKEV